MSRRTQQDPTRIAVVTVHGTGDGPKGVTGKKRLIPFFSGYKQRLVEAGVDPDGVEGQKWYQRGSSFSTRLTQRLASKGIEAEIVPVIWTGKNSSRGREEAAGELARTVRRTSKKFGGVHVVGHSHGGNVANEAASMLGWRLGRGRKDPMLSSVTTVGTPFFKAQLGWWESFGGIAFLGITAISIIGLLLAALVVLLVLPEYHLDAARYAQEFMAISQATGEAVTQAQVDTHVQEKLTEAREYRAFLLVMGAILPISAGTLLFVFPMAIEGFWRIMRVRRKPHPDARFFSLWHPNDEAIAFLKRVEELKIEPFPNGAIWRNSRTSAIVWGVRAVLLFFFTGLIVWALAMFGVNITDEHYAEFGNWLGFDGVAVFGGMTTSDLGIFLIIVGILGAPLIFGGAYILARLLLGLGLEVGARGVLNNGIASVLRGMAFGRDGDSRLGDISPQSHAYGTIPHVIEGEVGERMRKGAASAASALIEKYRWALFTVGPDTNGAVSNLANDAMTWDSLIHTTYFDQPEVADAIADYIAEVVAQQQAKEA